MNALTPTDIRHGWAIFGPLLSKHPEVVAQQGFQPQGNFIFWSLYLYSFIILNF